MPGLRSQWKAETVAAVTHLALLGVKNGETALWGIKKQNKTERMSVMPDIRFLYSKGKGKSRRRMHVL